ncbi:DUF5677 domain-containing protein [Streptomyces nigra]
MRLFGRRENSSMEEKFTDYVIKAVHDAGIEVTDEHDLTDIAVDSIDKFVGQMGKKVADHALGNRRTLRANRRIDREFNKRLERRYIQAFNAYIVATYCAREAGESIARSRPEHLTAPQEATFDALIGLHAKSCRVAGEILALLANGFPEGALARCRTLHEMAVVAGAIADATDDPDNEDLAIRFLDHGVVDLRNSAQRYQEDHVRLGMEPLEQDFLDKVEDGFNAAITKYGVDFKRDYGWAKKYCPDANFAGLEKKVRMGHMRGYYKWANNEVHAGSRSLSLNISEFRGRRLLRVGKTNVGLVDPASMALNSLHQVTVMLIVKGHSGSTDLTGLITMQALNEMRKRAEDMFLEADSEIMKDEEKVLRSLNL